VVLAVLLISAALSGTSAQEVKPSKADKKAPASAPPKEALSETNHSIQIAGTKLEYKATAGTLVLKGEDDKPRASVFFVAYTKAGVSDLANRPVTFAFNGGPGSSSVWLHMGALGPKRVLMADDGQALPPPYRLVDNEYTLLDLTDVVFIDPVSTGYSRPAPGQNAKEFHGVQEDLQSVGEFIRLYTTRFQRWPSPKFLAGESYGTTRAAGLSGYLQDQQGMNLNGIILISSILNFETASFDNGNDLAYPLFLPTYTATAWYHKKLSPDLQADLQKTLAEAKEFAIGAYTHALMQGNRLGLEEQRAIAKRLARYTGLSEDYVLRANLRVSIQRFVKELLRSERMTVGRYDSRLKGRDLDAVGERPEYDPSYAAVQGPYTATFNSYIRKELKYDSDLPYEILTGQVQPWNYGTARNRYLDMAPTLRQAITKNPALHVFVANGFYDLATPFFATEYTFSHLGLDPALVRNVSIGYYDAGHMMYIDKASLQKLRKDLAGLYQTALSK